MVKIAKITCSTVVLVLALVVFSSCAVYTFNPGGKSDIKSMAVERFESKTTEYGLADRVTDLVIDAFIEDGTMDIAAIENADAILEGTLVSYRRSPFNYDENDQVQAYSVTMVFDMALKKPGDDAEIWRETMKQEGVYDVDTETELDGQEKAVALLIDAIITRTTKSW